MNNAVERLARRFVPSLARLSYNPIFKMVVNGVGMIPAVFIRELRGLPPNHLRIRVGVGNRIFFNHFQFINAARDFWYNAFAAGTVKFDSNIVDIGCGCGRFAHHLRDYSFGSNGERYTGMYTGIDIDEELLAWDRSHFPPDNFQFLKSSDRSSVYSSSGDGGARYQLPLDDETQKFVFSTSLFTHLLEDELLNYIEEAYRVLRSGGTMQMTVFCMDLMREQRRLGGRFTFEHRIGNAYVESLQYPEAAVAFEREFLINTALAAGFSEATVIPGGQDILRCKR